MSKPPPQAPIDASEAGLRLDEVLAARLRSTRGFAQRLIEAGLVDLNGKRCRKGQRVLQGDFLRVDPIAVAGDRALPDSDLPLALVHEDPHLVVVDKPIGMPSHPLRPGERGSLASALLARYPEMAGVGHGPREAGLVHRLDVNTSGLVVAARDPITFARLFLALQSGLIDKRYQALVQGRPATGEARAHLAAQGAHVRVYDHPQALTQPISTHVCAVETVADHSRVELLVHRAARHQVRAHMAHIGHPLYGDTQYGGQPAYDGGGHVLHASRLAFDHPWTGERIVLAVAEPERFRACLAHSRE